MRNWTNPRQFDIPLKYAFSFTFHAEGINCSFEKLYTKYIFIILLIYLKMLV